MLTLEGYCGTSTSGNRIPEFVTGLEFDGYDSSGTTRDPKGVLRLRETSTRSDSDSKFYSNLPTLVDMCPREFTMGRTALDAEVMCLAKQIQKMENRTYIEHDFSDKRRNLLDRFNMLRRVQKQVEESLEDPEVYRESRGRLAANPVVNGVEYTVDMAWTQTQLGEGRLPCFLKGDELVVSDGSQKILAHRYGKDPRVVVEGTFEGDVRRPGNFSAELDEQTKVNLTILFKTLYKDIKEVCFPGSDRREVEKGE